CAEPRRLYRRLHALSQRKGQPGLSCRYVLQRDGWRTGNAPELQPRLLWALPECEPGTGRLGSQISEYEKGGEAIHRPFPFALATPQQDCAPVRKYSVAPSEIRSP